MLFKNIQFIYPVAIVAHFRRLPICSHPYPVDPVFLLLIPLPVSLGSIVPILDNQILRLVIIPSTEVAI